MIFIFANWSPGADSYVIQMCLLDCMCPNVSAEWEILQSPIAATRGRCNQREHTPESLCIDSACMGINNHPSNMWDRCLTTWTSCRVSVCSLWLFPSAETSTLPERERNLSISGHCSWFRTYRQYQASGLEHIWVSILFQRDSMWCWKTRIYMRKGEFTVKGISD